MKDWKPSKYWKRVNFIMMICTGYQNTDIMTATQCSVNIVKAGRCDMDIYSGDYKAMTSRNGHSSCSDCVCILEFIEFQDCVVEDLNKGIQALIREMSIGAPTMMLL